MMQVERDDLASARFGVEVHRADGHGGELMHLRAEATARGADLVIVRCEASDVPGIHAVERAGALLMDTHLSLERHTAPVSGRLAGDVTVRVGGPSDAQAVAALARDAFTDYHGHFHADPRLAPRATEVYEDWAVRSLSQPSVADVVLLAEGPDRALVGLTTLRLDGQTAIGVLDAVSPTARGRGVYARLGSARIDVARERGAHQIVVRTHLVNLGARRGLARLGFLPSAQEHTFHLWADAHVRRSSDRDALS